MDLLCLLAQMDPPAALSGSAGWVGAGMLGLVMSWLLLVHLPAKDKQMKDMVDMLAAHHREARADYIAAIDRIIERMP